MAAGAFLFLSAAAQGQSGPDFAITGSLRVTLMPEEAGSGASFQIVREKDAWGYWVADPGAWQPSGAEVRGLVPGVYTVVSRAPEGWADPGALEVRVAPGAASARIVRLQRLRTYLEVEDVPNLTVRHHDLLEFRIAEGARLVGFEAHDEIIRDVQLSGDIFTYRPSPEEREQFRVTLADASGNERTIAIQPLSVVEAEHTVIEFEGNVDPGAKKYLHVAWKNLELPSPPLNYRQGTVREVAISGATVVFEPGHENGLYDGLFALNGARDIRSLEVFADSVVIRAPLWLPQTSVTVNARELRFEDGAGIGSLVTTPVELPPLDCNGRCDGVRGQDGLRAGDVTFNVAAVRAPGPAKRLILKGGAGQTGEPGRNGADGYSLPALSAITDGAGTRHTTLVYSCDLYCQPVCGSCERRAGTDDCPGDGADAVAGGQPGNGGDAGQLRGPLDLSGIAELDGGQPGAAHGAYRGGAAGTPSNAKKARFVHYTFDIGNKWEVYGNCPATARGADRTSPGPTRGPGQSSAHLANDLLGNGFAWLHPVSVRAAVDLSRDAFLNGHRGLARGLLEPYSIALAAFISSGGVPDGVAVEIQQLHQEIVPLLSKLDNHLDYFGNPAGWVPLLSFEFAIQAFQREVAAAGDLLYLTRYLNEFAEEATSKGNALTRLRRELEAEKARFESHLEETQGALSVLRGQAESISGEIQRLGGQLRRREEDLENVAKLNTGVKKALRVAGAVLPLVPVGQPVLGLLGSQLPTVSRWNEQSAIDGAIEGTNAFSGFVHSNYLDGFEAFQANVQAGVLPKASLAMAGMQQGIARFDQGIEAVNTVLTEAKTWESDVDAELELLLAEDSAATRIVADIRALNARKQEFALDLAAKTQFAKDLMDGITRNILAIHSLNQDAMVANNRINPEAFGYVREVERRTMDRLLRYQYYLVKAYQYRMVRPFPDKDVYNLNDVFSFFRDNIQNDISTSTSARILDEQVLVNLYNEVLAQVADAIILDFASAAREQTLAGFEYKLSPQELDRLNNEPEGLALNLVEIGNRNAFILPHWENIRISDLKVATLRAGPRSGSEQANLAVTVQHSGLSLIESRGDVYKFDHSRTVESPPLTWEAIYSWESRTHTNTLVNQTQGKLLVTLLNILSDKGREIPEDIQIYSRPAARADLLLTKHTFAGDAGAAPADMAITELVLGISVDFFQKRQGQGGLEVQSQDVDGKALAVQVKVRADENGRADGRGRFHRVYPNGEVLSIEAPELWGPYAFRGWQVAGETALSGDPQKLFLLPGSPTSLARLARLHAVYERRGEVGGAAFRRGDSNRDGRVDLSDAVATLGVLFLGQGEIACQDAADANDDGRVDLSDTIVTLGVLFLGQGTIPLPGRELCGIDPSSDGVDCEDYGSCP